MYISVEDIDFVCFYKISIGFWIVLTLWYSLFFILITAEKPFLVVFVFNFAKRIKIIVFWLQFWLIKLWGRLVSMFFDCPSVVLSLQFYWCWFNGDNDNIFTLKSELHNKELQRQWSDRNAFIRFTCWCVQRGKWQYPFQVFYTEWLYYVV